MYDYILYTAITINILSVILNLRSYSRNVKLKKTYLKLMDKYKTCFTQTEVDTIVANIRRKQK